MNLFSIPHDPVDCNFHCPHHRRARDKAISAWIVWWCTIGFLLLSVLAGFAESPTRQNDDKLKRQGEVVLSLEEAFDLASVQNVWLELQGQMAQAENRLREIDKFMRELKPTHDEALQKWQAALKQATDKYELEIDEFLKFILAEKKLKGTKKLEPALSEKKP